MERIVRYGLYLCLIVLPFQTRYLIIESANPFATVSIYGFDLLILFVGLLWLWNWYHSAHHHIHWTPIVTVLSFLLLAGCSSYFAEDQQVALYYWLQLTLGFWLLAMLVTSKLKHETILIVFLINGGLQALTANLQFVMQHVVANKWLGVATQLPELSGASVVVTAAGRWLRAYALLPHPNIAGGIIMLGLVAAALLSKRYWWLATTGALLSFSLVLTFSRGAFIAWCIVLMILTITRQVRASYILTVLATIAISLSVYWPLVTSRTSTAQFTEQLSVSERQAQLEQFQTIFTARWPFGVGLGQYTVTAAPVSPFNYAQPIHNVWLMILVEVGVLGSVLWLAIIVQPIWKLSYKLMHHPAAYFLVSILLLGIFDHYFWTLPSFAILWCVVIGWLWLQMPQHQPKVAKAASDHK